MRISSPPPPPPSWLAPFLAHCHVRQYEKQIDVIRPGDPAESFYYLVEGSVAALIDDRQTRREILLAYINQGEFIGEMGLFMPPETRGTIVRTRTRCRIAEIPYRRLDRLLADELLEVAPDFLRSVGRQLALRLQRTSRKVGQLAFLDVKGRIARILLDLCLQPEAMTHPDGMQIRVTRLELARIAGCSREMAGRVLKDLEEEGRIGASGKTIVVRGDRRRIRDGLPPDPPRSPAAGPG